MSISLRRPWTHRFIARLVALTAAASLVSQLIACSVFLPSSAPKAPTPEDSLLASAALQGIVDQYIRHEQMERFELRVRLGSALDRIPEFSERNTREDARFARATMRRIDWISVDALDEADYLNLLAVRSAFQGSSDRALYYANDLTPFFRGSPLAHIVRMMSELPLNDAGDVARYGFLLEALAPFADTLRTDLMKRAAQGILLGREGVAHAAPFFAAFEAPSPSSVLRITPDRVRSLDSVTARRLMATTDSAIDGNIVPAFRRLTTYLTGEYSTTGPVGVGLWQYVGGKEYYRALVRRWTSLDITPELAHEAGLREVARLDTAMATLRLRMGGSAVADSFHAALRRDERFRSLTRDELVDKILLAQGTLAPPSDSSSQSQGFFPVVIVAENELDTRDAVFGWYRQPSGVDSVGQYTPGRSVLAPGVSIVAEPLSYFALSPGRHELLGQRLSQSRMLARWYASVPAFSDGWGLYALDLARERGALTDPFAAYGALMLEMIAAVRLTVDSGLHYFGWTADQSLQFIQHHTMLADAEAQDEVARIAYDAPGLGLAASMGVREIRGVRHWMERELKKDFDEGRFNAELRSLGPLPLRALGSHFEWWLWKERSRLRGTAEPIKANAKKAAR